MKSTDVSDSLDRALAFTELNTVKVKHKARLLSDNGPCYLSGELAEYLIDNHMMHTRAKPCYPPTQGRIERWHRSMKNQVLLENYYLPKSLNRGLVSSWMITIMSATTSRWITWHRMGEGKPYLSAESVLNWKPWKCEDRSITLTGLISSIDGWMELSLGLNPALSNRLWRRSASFQ